MKDSIVIVGMARTPLGGLAGALSRVSAPKLGAASISAALTDAGVRPSDVDEVFMGCVLQAGVGQAPARQAALGACIPSSVPTTTVNKVCGSGMKTIMLGCQALMCGEASVVVAGGMESMSNAPYMLPKARGGYRLGHGELKDHMFTDGLEDAYEGSLMGVYAENTADEYQISREEQDAFAIESLQRAQRAIFGGVFRREVCAVSVYSRTANEVVKTDEQPGQAKLEKIPLLKSAFKSGGSVTAANSSSISDGAASVVLMRESEAKKRGLNIIAKVSAYAQHAHEPEWFTTAPVEAIRTLLQKCQWELSEVDLFEINEAFAVVTLAAMKVLGLDRNKVNIHGGACALGHPLGASGARILVTLLAALERQGLKKGVASLCIGGGEAVAMAVERP